MTGPRAAAVASSPSWPRLVIVGARTFALSLLGSLVAWTLLAAVLGRLDPVVITSGSMAPGIRPGDVVLAGAPSVDRLVAGRVVTFLDPARPDRLVTHRVDAVLDDGRLRTRGDANAAPDSTPVPVEAVVGEGRLLVPMLGIPLVWWRDGELVRLALWAALTLAVALVPVGGRPREHRRPAAGRIRDPAPPRPDAPLPRGEPVHARGERAPPRSDLFHARGRPPGSPDSPAPPPAGDLRARPRRRAVRSATRSAVVAGAVAAVLSVPAAPVLAWAATTATTGNGWDAATITAPTGLVSTGGCRLLVLGPKVDLSWEAVAADGYVVLRGDDPGGPYSQVGTVSGGTTTTYTDTTVATNTTYHYVVRATAGTWSSVDSTEASATTPATCV